MKARLSIVILFVSYCLCPGDAISCYTCTSINGGDKRCEDGSYRMGYQENCVPNEPGQFIGNSFGIGNNARLKCVKVIGRDTGSQRDEIVTIRTCSTHDRNECKNPILINGKSIDGCVYTCDSKYCNGSPGVRGSVLFALILAFAVITIY